MTSKIIYTLSLLSVLICSPILAQDLRVKVVDGIYTNNNFASSLTSNQALLAYTVVPNGAINNASIVTYQDLKSNKFDLSPYTGTRSYARVHPTDDVLYCIAVIDSEYYYASSDTTALENTLLPRLNKALSDRGLGNASQRRSFIGMLNNVAFGLVPPNFTSSLRAWIIAGISIFLAVPFWFILRRFLRG